MVVHAVEYVFVVLWLISCNEHCWLISSVAIRECGSVLYLGMAKEISKYHTDAPAGKLASYPGSRK